MAERKRTRGDKSLGCYGASLRSTSAQVCPTPRERAGKGRCNPLFQGDKMLSVGDGILHGQMSLPHTHRPDTTQLLRTECQHATTNLPAPSPHARRQKTTGSRLHPARGHIQRCHGVLPQGLSHPEPDHTSWRGLAAQRAQPDKQLSKNASGAATPQKGSPPSRSAPPAPPVDEVLL